MDKRSMVPSDFGMVKDLVVKYGNKETIGRLAAMGQIDPTSAVLAGMMIDRIRGNAAMEQQPQTTVAQDVMAAQPQQAAGLGAIAPQGMQAAAPPMQPAAPPMQAPAGMASGGIAALDVPDDMFNEYASGGLVAFEDGGEVPSFQLGGVPGAFDVPSAAQPTALTPFMNTRAKLRAKYGPEVVDKMSDTELQMLEARAIMGREPMQEAVGPQVSGDIGQRALAMAQTLFPKTGIETTPYGLEQGMTDVKAAQKAAGVDTDLYKSQRADVEQQRAENKATRTESANMRLIEAGLGILGGTSPFASVNIGQGAAPAVKGFAQDVKDIQKLDRELARDMQNLELAEDKVRRGDATAAQARVDDRLKTIQALQLKRAEAASDISQKMITGDYGVMAQQIASEKSATADRQIQNEANGMAYSLYKTSFEELNEQQKAELLAAATANYQTRTAQVRNIPGLLSAGAAQNQADVAAQKAATDLADKARDNVDKSLAENYNSPQNRRINELRKQDKKNGTSTAEDYVNDLYDKEEKRLRNAQSASGQTSANQPPAGPSRAAAQQTAGTQPVPAGVPKGAVAVGIDRKTGKTVYQTQDGKKYIEQ